MTNSEIFILSLVWLLIIYITWTVIATRNNKDDGGDDEDFTGSQDGMILSEPRPWRCPCGKFNTCTR